jgi:hypothetical protein
LTMYVGKFHCWVFRTYSSFIDDSMRVEEGYCTDG